MKKAFFVLLLAILIAGSGIGYQVHAAALERGLREKGLDDGFKNVVKIAGFGNVKTYADFPTFMNAVLKAVAFLIPVVALLVIIYAGIVYITALGDEKKTEKAKHIILYTVLGMIVIGLAVLIVNAILNLVVNQGGAAH